MPRFGAVLCDDGQIILGDIGGITPLTAPSVQNPGARWLGFAVSAKLLLFIINAEKDTGNRHLDFLKKVVAINRPAFISKKRLVVFNHFGVVNNGIATPAGLQSVYQGEKALHINAMNGGGIKELTACIADIIKGESYA
jgi:tRNA U34 5-carboxymethylaminomethyl modifying GTPase MnmE/TrmE